MPEPPEGAEVWRFEAGTGCGTGLCGFEGERNEVESSPIVVDGKVLFGLDVNDVEGGKGGFYAVDVRGGHLLWYFDLETGATCRPLEGDIIRRFDGYHSETELGLPAGFLATRAGCSVERIGTGCGNVWSSATVDEARGLFYFVSSNCDTDDDPATVKPPPPMPPFDEAIIALRLDGTPAWRWRPREVDNLDLAFGAVPNLFAIEAGGARRDVVGVGGKDGTYYVIDREGVNAVTGSRWDDADPSALPYWRQNVVPGGEIGGIIATAAVDESAGRIYFSTAPGLDIFAPQRPTVHALDANSGAILWQNTGETNADSSFAPTSAIPGLVFVGGASGGALRAYDSATGARLARIPLTFSLASAPAVVDGLVILGAGTGARGFDRLAQLASDTPSKVTALCVPCTPACVGAAPPEPDDADRDGCPIALGDCDDTNPAVYPGTAEVSGNDVDEDCDGVLGRARDRCRQGGNALGDRRQLASVEQAVHAACPCEDFTGHQAYVACARQAIAAAVAAGELRRRCREDALAAERVSTCGAAAKVVCCQRRGQGRPGCKIVRAERCESTARVVRDRCAATHCAATDCAAAGVCTAPP